MDSYSKSRDLFRCRDDRTEQLKREQRKLPKGKRKALIERALTVQFDKQQGRAP